MVGDLREPAQITDMRTAEEKPSDRLRGKVNVLYYLGYHQSASIPENDSYAAFADGGRLIHRFRGPPSPAGEGKRAIVFGIIKYALDAVVFLNYSSPANRIF